MKRYYSTKVEALMIQDAVDELAVIMDVLYEATAGLEAHLTLSPQKILDATSGVYKPLMRINNLVSSIKRSHDGSPSSVQ